METARAGSCMRSRLRRWATVTAVLVLAAACQAGAEGRAPLADAPQSEDDRLASAALLAISDLPDGFMLAPHVELIPDPDVVECEALVGLAETYGNRTSGWDIDYVGPDDYGAFVHLKQFVLVWEQPVAEERAAAGLTMFGDCWTARFKRNYEANDEALPHELLDISSSPIEITTSGGKQAGGFRIEAQFTEAQLPYSVYGDVFFVADRRIMSVVFVVGVAEPGSEALEALVIDRVSSKLARVQR